MSEFYLSIVASSRNDNHGGQLIERMQAFVDGIIQQSQRHQFPIELILVEWNPPQDRPTLAHALHIPRNKPYCTVRIITVSPELHQTFEGAENMPLYQMIAKNVGIRRARGEYVLATNIDILFSDELFTFFKKRRLRPGTVYRVDRLDVPANIPETVPFDKVLDFCHGNFFRINGRFETKILTSNKQRKKKKKTSVSVKGTFFFLKKLTRKVVTINILNPMYWWTLILEFYKSTVSQKFLTKFLYLIKMLKFYLIPHSNGCGDFTLLSKKGWEILRGYPEWPVFSWHIDSLFLYQAIMSDFWQKNFGSTRPIYHIEHGIGSGYTPEGLEVLFERLEDKNIPYLDMPAFNEHVAALIKAKRYAKTLIYNGEKWGMIDQQLKEVTL